MLRLQDAWKSFSSFAAALARRRTALPLPHASAYAYTVLVQISGDFAAWAG
jgi:hypothetical protein